jgi:hypothetical protein
LFVLRIYFAAAGRRRVMLEFTLERASMNKLKLELQPAARISAFLGSPAGSAKVIQCFTNVSTCPSA